MILPIRDVVKYHCSLERRQRERKRCDEQLWQRIERHSGTAWLSVTAPALLQALRHALRSLRVPESANPRVLSPAQSLEAAVVLRKISQFCDNASRGVSGSTEEVHTMIFAEAQSALQELYGCAPFEPAICTLPGWSPFLDRWLERTVKLAAQLDYQGEDEWQVYGEVPDSDIVFEDESKLDAVEELMDKITV